MADLPQDFISPVTGKPLGGETTTIDKATSLCDWSSDVCSSDLRRQIKQ